MEDLREYLKNQDKKYADGVALYEKYHGRDKHLQFFRQLSDADPSSMHWKMLMPKLENRLRILSTLQPESMNEVKITPTVPIQIRRLNTTKTDAAIELKLNEEMLPDHIRELYIKQKSLILEIAGHHGAMKSAKDDAGRQFQLQMITRLQEEKDENWKKIDEWLKENKQAISTGDIKTADEKRIETLKKHIRRANLEIREKKNMYSSEQIASRKGKITAWKKELNDLKALTKKK